MPANLTPQYKKAEERYRQAREPEERLAALEEMLRLIPKHKGTDHLQADLKKKLKEARAELQSAKSAGKKAPSWSVPRSAGYPQVVVVGPPNAGKSALIAALTGADLEVAPYPYTTREPRPAMMRFENVKVQLVDTPPIFADSMEPWISSLVRAGDAAVLVADLGAPDLLESLEGVLAQLAAHKLYLGPLPSEARETPGAAAMTTLIAANKLDAEGARDQLPVIQELYGRFEILPVSVATAEGLETLRRRIWEVLGLVRAIPKPPGKPPDKDAPILLPRGSTVVDMARAVHNELAERLKSARIWGSRNHPDGQWVPRSHVVEDGEILALEE